MFLPPMTMPPTAKQTMTGEPKPNPLGQHLYGPWYELGIVDDDYNMLHVRVGMKRGVVVRLGEGFAGSEIMWEMGEFTWKNPVFMRTFTQSARGKRVVCQCRAKFWANTDVRVELSLEFVRVTSG